MQEPKWAAVVTDIHEGDIRLILRRRFEPGTALRIELAAPDDAEPNTVLAKVIHVRALGKSSWALSCKFISELGEDELQHLLSPRPVPQPEVPQDHSGAKTIPEVHFQIDLPSGTPIDWNIRHLCVPESWPLPAGKIVTMQGGTRNGPLPPLRIQVVHCAQQGDRWTVRCLLLDSPTPELLRALGRPATPAAENAAPAFA
jgi:hypothetical protein